MSDELTIRDLLLYSQCPMRYNFSKTLGINERTSTITGQIEEVIETSIHSFLHRTGDYNALAHTIRTFNNLSSKIYVPSDYRGSPRKMNDYRNRIDEARERVRFAVGYLADMKYEMLGAPYNYELTILDHVIGGSIDAILKIDGRVDIITFDFNKGYPSDEFMENGRECTIAINVFRKLFPEVEYRIIHFNIYNIAYIEVNRTPAQLMACDYELKSIVSSLMNANNTGGWYRSKSFICNTCYANVPCDEIFRRMSQYG